MLDSNLGKRLNTNGAQALDTPNTSPYVTVHVSRRFRLSELSYKFSRYLLIAIADNPTICEMILKIASEFQSEFQTKRQTSPYLKQTFSL
ncbi:MAG: hypothetical protein ACTS2F_09845 [Thainema sp.]